MVPSIEALTDDLRRLGVAAGDHILVRTAENATTRRAAANRASAIVQALLDVVGPQGTVAALTFSRGFLRPSKHPDKAFSLGSRSITGAFAEAVRTWPTALRSRHPLNSFSAIGARAEELVRDHGPHSACFSPMEKLVEWRGKMLLIGCVSSSPGFSTVHLAQQHLGLSERNWMSGLKGTLWRDDDGTLHVFRPRDIPGCSAGFGKYYAEYVRRGVLSTGLVGDAYSIMVGCAEAYSIERELLAKDPRSALCSNPNCMACRATLYYNKRDWLPYFLRNGRRFARQGWAQMQGRRSPR